MYFVKLLIVIIISLSSCLLDYISRNRATDTFVPNLTPNTVPNPTLNTSNIVPNPTVPTPSAEPVVIQDDVAASDLKSPKKETDDEVLTSKRKPTRNSDVWDHYTKVKD